MMPPRRYACLFLLAIGLLLDATTGLAADDRRAGDNNAEAPMWWFGFQLYGITDGAMPEYTPDTDTAYQANDTTYFGWGAGLTLPLGINFYNGLGMRAALSVAYSGDPFDQAVTQITYLDNTEDGIERKYLTRDGFFGSGQLLFDVQYLFPLLFGTVKPYLGAGPGIFLNYVFTDLTIEDFELLDNEYNDPDDPNNIDPYSVNLAPGFNGYFGVNFKVTGSMHLNFEVEYDVAKMKEAPLLKATDGADARRAGYLYSTFKLSSGLLFNF